MKLESQTEVKKGSLIKEALVFLRESITDFHHTGSLCATSKWAAIELTRQVRGNRKPLNILEVGAGTGSVTVQILKDLIPGDRLTVCELNPRFMKELRERLQGNSDFQKFASSITFFEGAVQELPEEAGFDVIVSALPFLNFDLKTVEDIFTKFEKLSFGHTVMTYYEYMGLRDFGMIVSPKDRRDRLKSLDQYFTERHSRDKIDRKRVWFNFLPINIYTIKIPQSPSSKSYN